MLLNHLCEECHLHWQKTGHSSGPNWIAHLSCRGAPLGWWSVHDYCHVRLALYFKQFNDERMKCLDPTASKQWTHPSEYPSFWVPPFLAAIKMYQSNALHFNLYSRMAPVKSAQKSLVGSTPDSTSHPSPSYLGQSQNEDQQNTGNMCKRTWTSSRGRWFWSMSCMWDCTPDILWTFDMIPHTTWSLVWMIGRWELPPLCPSEQPPSLILISQCIYDHHEWQKCAHQWTANMCLPTLGQQAFCTVHTLVCSLWLKCGICLFAVPHSGPVLPLASP